MKTQKEPHDIVGYLGTRNNTRFADGRLQYRKD